MGLGLKAQKSVVSDQLGRPGSGTLVWLKKTWRTLIVANCGKGAFSVQSAVSIVVHSHVSLHALAWRV